MIWPEDVSAQPFHTRTQVARHLWRMMFFFLVLDMFRSFSKIKDYLVCDLRDATLTLRELSEERD